MTLFSTLYIFLTISVRLCLCKKSLSPAAWATVATSPADSSFVIDGFNLASSLLHVDGGTNGTIPIVGYYGGDVHIIDTFNNITYYADTSQSISEPTGGWMAATTDEIPLDVSFFEFDNDNISFARVYPSQWSIFTTGACTSFKCYTQIGEIMYIIYDSIPQIIRYDLRKKTFEETVPFKYPGYYCLVSDNTHIFAIGDQPNILIISKDDLTKISYSSDYIAADIDDYTKSLTCSMDENKQYIYIFTFYGAFTYSIAKDKLSVMYNRNEYYLPYNNSNSNHSLLSTTAANFIWIQAGQSVYPFSTVTNRFLGCRVHNDLGLYDHVQNTLVSLDNSVFKMGGVDVAINPNVTDNDLFQASIIRFAMYDSISLLDTHFTDNRFQIMDWYHPFYPLAINYTDGLAELGNVTDGFVQVDLTSLDFSVKSIYIDIHTSVSASNPNDECEVCYGGILGAAYCCTTCTKGFCLSDGLVTDIYDIDPYIQLANDEQIDIKDMQYSIEVATTVGTVSQSNDPAFICNSFPIYPVYLTLNVSLLSADYFYFNIDYEYKCNGCSVDSFNDISYGFNSEIKLKSKSLGLNDITLQIVNQKSCVIMDGNMQYQCNNYSLLRKYFGMCRILSYIV